MIKLSIDELRKLSIPELEDLSVEVWDYSKHIDAILKYKKLVK